MNPRSNPLRTPLSLVAGLCLLAACASGAPRLREGEKCRVTLRDRRTGNSFHLVNEAYGPREAFYSRQREDAATKVLPNSESMQYLLDRLEECGFGGLASPGEAPAQASGVGSYSITVERGGAVRSVVRGASDPPERTESIGAMVNVFREVYDGTYAAQTILNPGGADYFERAKRKLEQTKRTGAQPPGA